MKRPVFLYVDYSNIQIGMKGVAKKKGDSVKTVRLHVPAFVKLVAGHVKRMEQIVWVGSSLTTDSDTTLALIELGITPIQIPRGENESENGTIDTAIQLAMYRNARKHRSKTGTIILCTGDGSGFEEHKGFLHDVEGFVEDGWSIILYSWHKNANNLLVRFCKKHGKYVKLDDYYEKITYKPDKRAHKRVVLKQKPEIPL